MAHSVFIDGEAGTTGLQIRQRLEGRSDITLVQIDPQRRKDAEARREALAAADVAILCLPDDAARDAVALAEGLSVKFIDASTAHRVADGWTYGFPELDTKTRNAIAASARVSNPGCYSTGAIAIINPLVKSGLITPDEALSIFGVSGYTGGGKAMIAEYEEGSAPPHFIYGLTQAHKHLPEIMARTGLKTQPVFSPSVGNFAQGMAIQVPVHLHDGRTMADLHAALSDHYSGAQFVSVRGTDEFGGRVVPTALNDTNHLQLSVHGSDEHGCATIIAVLDNLGKGASGAAVQNLNIMLGEEESLGL